MEAVAKAVTKTTITASGIDLWIAIPTTSITSASFILTNYLAGHLFTLLFSHLITSIDGRWPPLYPFVFVPLS